ncbi:MAG: hypothetical protein A2219_07320 [Elusimicrobia bacterium RIFOXYA2_FULL_50_26]|nr:MAG: hypothetical protein A2219_07320 [Elusimicrobia bacterium RIFOXYA2_FULL_50_26]OGS23147.1 MAG: hypothetical protein A2314_04915 [Elusimicrobia bacterium RIFOXYB2_FULL_50_12]
MNISQRLKQLRMARGLSLDALAATMGSIVTKQAISKYEKGKSLPSPVVMNRLAVALGVKAAYLLREPSLKVEFISYRKRSTLSKKVKNTVESVVSQSLEERVRLQQILGYNCNSDLSVKHLSIKNVEDAENAACELREKWALGVDPIANVVSVLEAHCIHVLKIETDTKFDGISAVATDEHNHVLSSAVVTRDGVSGERQRLNLLHELGHLVLKMPKSVDEEKAAFRFGAAFLAPADSLRREVGVHRGSITSAELLLLKKQFGMSIQALLYRLRNLGIISESYFKKYCISINKLGWKKREPEELEPEQSEWLYRNVLRALSEGFMSKTDAERILSKPVNVEESLALVNRQAFLKLPLAERRRLLAEQAKGALHLYEENRKQDDDLQGGDIVEY